MTELHKQTVLLTGALGSLGRAQAQALHAAGADLIRPSSGRSLRRHRYPDQRRRTDHQRAVRGLLDRRVRNHVRVEVSTAFALCRTSAPGMKAKRAGRIVNLCSITLNGDGDGDVPYVTSEGAKLGMRKSLARELGPSGIGVDGVPQRALASEAETRVLGDHAQAYNDWILARQGLTTRIEPDAIANLVLFLVSPAAAMITGQNIACNGGW